MFNTATLLENKQLMHVAAEVVVLIGIIYYINQKNATCAKNIDKLVQRIEEQEDIIQRHEQLINKLISALESTTSSRVPEGPVNNKVRKYSKPVTQSKPDSDNSKIATSLRSSRFTPPPPPSPSSSSSPPSPPTSKGFKQPPRYEDDNSDTDRDSEEEEEEELDIDELLAEELRELNESTVEENTIEVSDGVEVLSERSGK